MRRLLCTVHGGGGSSSALLGVICANGLSSQTTPFLPLAPSVRFQSGGFGRGGGGGGGRGFGRGGGGGRGGGVNNNGSGDGGRRTVLNQTGDGELSDATRKIMRDDGEILTSVVKHIPPNGAISVKSLNAQLSPDVQEALSEKYDGLGGFLQQRKQLFVVKARPNDGVLYVASTPLAHQKLVAREQQRRTMLEMLGLNRRGGRGGGRGGNGRGRGGNGRGNGNGRGGNGRGNGNGGRGGRGGFGRGRGGGADRSVERGGGGGRGGFRGRGGGGGGGFGGEGRNFGSQQEQRR